MDTIQTKAISVCVCISVYVYVYVILVLFHPGQMVPVTYDLRFTKDYSTLASENCTNTIQI